MTSKNTRKIFVNLPIRDLKRSVDFFTALGFTFNAQFSDDKATMMIINEDASVMLLTEPFFRTFTRREVCGQNATEALIALSCESRAAVDDMVQKALAAGGSAAMPAQDHGFMYGHSFYDLDGHHWEVVWMDPSVPQPQ